MKTHLTPFSDAFGWLGANDAPPGSPPQAASGLAAWTPGIAAGGLCLFGLQVLSRVAGTEGAAVMLAIFTVGVVTLVSGARSGMASAAMLVTYLALPAEDSTNQQVLLVALGLAGAGFAAWGLRHQGFVSARRDRASRARVNAIESQFSALTETIGIGVFVTDGEGRVQRGNARFRELLGLGSGPVDADCITGALHPDERMATRDEWLRAIRQGKPFLGENRLCGSVIKGRTVRVFANPVAGEDGVRGYVGTVEDVTQLKSIETQLLESQRRLNVITDNVPAAIAYIDTGLRYGFVNHAFEKLFGVRRVDVLGRTTKDVLSAEDLAVVAPMYARAAFGESVRSESALNRPGQPQRWVERNIVPHRAQDGGVVGFFAMVIDITERRRAEQALAFSRERAVVTLGAISDAVITTDGRGRIDFLNAAARRLLGERGTTAMGKLADSVLDFSGDDPDALHPVREVLSHVRHVAANTVAGRLVAVDGRVTEIDLSISPIPCVDGSPGGCVVILRDATEARRHAEQLAWQATHDPLTGLDNRRGFEAAVASAREKGKAFAVLGLDLDRFKAINDSEGHAAGDRVLREVAVRLSHEVADAGMIARVGGDEFAAFLPGCTAEGARALAENLRKAVDGMRFAFRGRTHGIGVSVGVLAVQELNSSVAEILDAADRALYRAKREGRNRVAEASAPGSVDQAVADGVVRGLRVAV